MTSNMRRCRLATDFLHDIMNDSIMLDCDIEHILSSVYGQIVLDHSHQQQNYKLTRHSIFVHDRNASCPNNLAQNLYDCFHAYTENVLFGMQEIHVKNILKQPNK